MKNVEQTAFALLQAEKRRKELEIETLLADLRKDPAFAAAESKKLQLTFQAARLRSQNKPIGQLQDEIDKAIADFRLALAAHGKTEADLLYRPDCPVCGDRGMKDGALCECIRRKMFELLSEDCPDRVTDKKTFTKGDLDALPEGDRDAYRNAYNLLKALASKFPAQKTSIFGISGPVGSGKSYAATVFANMVMDKGHTALIYPASMMNRLFLSSHLAPIERKREILMPLEECDLLVIDDLGTETEYNNVTLPYLYELIAVRAGKLTMITTNLDESGVLSRYGDRIFSRLFDRAAAKWIALNGPDLRLRDKPRQ